MDFNDNVNSFWPTKIDRVQLAQNIYPHLARIASNTVADVAAIYVTLGNQLLPISATLFVPDVRKEKSKNLREK